jgi:hypothetical protein
MGQRRSISSGPARWTNRIQRDENFRQVDLAFLHRAIIEGFAIDSPSLFSSFSDLYCPTVRPVRLEFYDHPFACPHCSVGDGALAALLSILQETYPH